MKRRSFLTFFGVIFLCAIGTETSAQSVFVEDFASSPAGSSVSVRSQGRKGMRILMGGTPGQFPIDVSGATVTLTINATVHTCSFNIFTPVNDGDCGFVGVRFDQTALHPQVDTVEIFFRGDFPAGASVVESVVNVKGADNVVETTAGTVSFTADNGGIRQTTSMELVFDTSGSMASPLAATTNPGAKARIDALKDAANELFVLLGAHAVVGDRVGELFFNSNVVPGGGVLGSANDPSVISSLRNNVAIAAAGGSTAMGQGLLAAQGGLSGDSNTKQYIFVFSDGEQNTPTLINFPVPAGGPIGVGGANIPNTIKVCTITMGTQSAPGYILQDEMAAVGCPDNHSLFVNATDTTFAQANLDTYFTSEIITALGGDKLEIVKDVVGTAGATAVTEQFRGNTNDIATSILLSWDQGREQRPKLTLTAPDGTVVDLAGRITLQAKLAFINLQFPLKQGGSTINQKGAWQLGISTSGAVTGAGPLNYHLLVVSDNSTIDTSAALQIDDAGTGEAVPIKVVAKDGGAPVTGANVVALLLGPDNGLGDILAKAADPSGNPNTNGDGTGSAASSKLLLLLNDPQFLALLKNHNFPLVTLTDPMNTGVYTGTFTGAAKEGHYQFLVAINGTTAGNGTFERTRTLTLFVRPKPDLGKTDFVVVSRAPQPNGTVLVHLRAIPRDRFGSFLGPDYLPILNITCSPCSPSSPIADDLHGAYDVTYQLLSAGVNPTVSLVLLGNTIISSPLNSLPGGGPGGGPGSGGKFAISFHLGATFPHSGFTGLSSSVSVGGDFEYRVPYGLSLETYGGYDHFSGGTGAHLGNLSERIKYTYGLGSWRPFAFFGGGGYFASGGNNYGGINTGGGVQYWINPHVAVEGTYTFHSVFVSGSTAKYSTVLAGVRYVF